MVGAITLQVTPAITALLFILASCSYMSRVKNVGFSSFNAFPLLVLNWGVLTHNRSTDLQTLAFLVCDHSVRLSLKTSATFDILRLATPRLFLTPRLSQSKIIGYYRQVYRFSRVTSGTRTHAWRNHNPLP